MSNGVDGKALNNALNKMLENDNEKSISDIIEMGFPREDAIMALKHCGNDVYKAIEFLINGGPSENDLVAIQYDNMQYSPESHQQQLSSQEKDGNEGALSQRTYDVQDETRDIPTPISSQSQLSETFGNSQLLPATKEFYDSNQWGIIPYSETSSADRVDQTDSLKNATIRLREQEENPLLVPTSDALYIGPLLMILHSIPLGRSSLLNGGKDIIQDYGFDPNWWNNAFIDLPGNPQFRTENSYERTMVETQRLCAFLDGGSRRPWASIRNLATIAPVETSIKSLCGALTDDNPVGRFLQDLTIFWTQHNQEQFLQTYQTSARTPDNDESYQKFTNLITEVIVAIEDSLYGLIDDLIWPPPHHSEAYLENLADIVTITVKRDDGLSGTGITIPTIWYPDRYTKEVLPFIQTLQTRKKDMLKEIASLQTQKFQLANTMGKDTTKLLQVTVDYLKNELNNNSVKERNIESDSEATSPNSQNFNDKEHTQNALEDIERVQKSFEEQKSAIQNRISYLQERIKLESTFLKGPTDPTIKEVFADSEIPTLRPYLLSGAIISPTEYCFKSNLNKNFSSENLIDLTDDASEDDNNDTANSCPWYRVNSFSNGPKAEPISEDEMLELLKVGSADYSWQEVILVYANEYAWDPSKHDTILTEALKKFVAQDKKTLIHSLQSQSSLEKQQKNLISSNNLIENFKDNNCQDSDAAISISDSQSSDLIDTNSESQANNERKESVYID